MEQILKVLTLYDLTAYLLPGLVFVWAILRLVSVIAGDEQRWSWQLIVAAYVAGQLFQAAMSGQRLLSPWPTPLWFQPIEQVYNQPGDEQWRGTLAAVVNKAFGSPPPGKESFLLCESYVQAKKLDSFIEIMQARYAFFRGLFISLIFAGAALAIEALLRTRARDSSDKLRLKVSARAESVVLALVCFAAAAISYARIQDYDLYYTTAVYRTFYVDYMLGPASPRAAE